ncbi:MAG: pyruvate kinase [Deltaproteobacteria bacterium]|nr:pyruvate kinase [Deltaproteobacteria bacterium]
MRRAKIVCTIGPASREPEVLERLVDAGMDVARLNMSHGTQEEHAEVARRVRRIAEARGRPVAILQDLSGPKLRLGTLGAPVLLHAGDEVTLTVEDVVGEGLVLPVRYPALPRELTPGDRLSLADGLILLEVVDRGPASVRARVLSGGQVTSRKGVNLPTGGDALPSMTPKDVDDLRFGLQMGADAVALSFVRSARDAEGPRAIMDEVGRRVPLLAKIEKRQALHDIDAIVAAFDGLMVARGDLGVEVDLEDVPGIQKDLITRANQAAKPVITATQMLLSMVSSPRPTRAEVTDVANAILDGTDAVMLSEETAQGQYPAEAVATMATLADRAEDLRHRRAPDRRTSPEANVAAAIASATWQVARQVGAAAVVTPTASGSTARLVASTRPAVPILALSALASTVQGLCFTWGVVPRLMASVPTTDALFRACRDEALAAGLARPGDRIVLTAGLPLDQPGGTNLLKVLEV